LRYDPLCILVDFVEDETWSLEINFFYIDQPKKLHIISIILGRRLVARQACISTRLSKANQNEEEVGENPKNFVPTFLRLCSIGEWNFFCLREGAPRSDKQGLPAISYDLSAAAHIADFLSVVWNQDIPLPAWRWRYW
jgi:hypothetical protein